MASVAAGHKAHAAEAAHLAADEGDHRQLALGVLDQIHHLRMGQQAGVGLMQADAAGFKGDHHRRR